MRRYVEQSLRLRLINGYAKRALQRLSPASLFLLKSGKENFIGRAALSRLNWWLSQRLLQKDSWEGFMGIIGSCIKGSYTKDDYWRKHWLSIIDLLGRIICAWMLGANDWSFGRVIGTWIMGWLRGDTKNETEIRRIEQKFTGCNAP